MGNKNKYSNLDSIFVVVDNNTILHSTDSYD